MANDDTTVPTSIRSSWRESERRLYPLATTDPARYERVILVVRAVADELRTVHSIAALAELWPRADELVEAVASRSAGADGLPTSHIAGAAFSLRYGELDAEAHRRAVRERIETARRGGCTWILLHERGDLDAGLADPYQATEMHLASGLALVTTVEIDPDRGSPSFVAAVARLDPETGDLVDVEPGIGDWEEHSDRERFEAYCDTLRRCVESAPA